MATAAMFYLDDVSADVLRLSGTDAYHAFVRRLAVGEQVDVSDGRGSVAHCVVDTVSRDAFAMSVVDRRLDAEPQPRIVVVQALAKGDAAEDAVTAMTEVGVDEIVPWGAARSVAQWSGDRGARSLRRWRSAAYEAAKQSRRSWLPVVSELATTAAVVERLHAAALPVVLHESATTPLATLEVPTTGDVVVVVGPEGGLTDDEIAGFGAAYRLGDSVLRSATAGVVAAAALLSRTPRWS